MWARIMGSQLVEIIHRPKSMYINDIQYPKSIFGSSWTNAERKELGIVPYEYEGSFVENMFYTTSEAAPVVESDRVVVRRTQSANNVDDIKAVMKNSVSKTLGSYLDQTDWIVIREQDNGTAKPADLAKWRTDLRKKAAALETSSDSKSDVAGLEAMTIVTPEMIEKEENAEFHDWPVNPRESAV